MEAESLWVPSGGSGRSLEKDEASQAAAPGRPRGGMSVAASMPRGDGRSGQACKVTQDPATHPGGLGREAEKGASVWHRA